MKLKHYIFACLSLLGFVSCSEDDGNDFDADLWKELNTKYFEMKYQTHSVKSDDSFILPGWSMPSDLSLEELAHTNCILVDVVTKGSGTTSPEYTDSAAVHYSGRLIPTEDYPLGYEFDHSYLTTYDPDVDVAARVAVKSLVDGFSTALQHMHRGDHWKVIIPHQLGYGSTDQTTIPAYSTLVFDIYLEDFWKKKEGDRD